MNNEEVVLGRAPQGNITHRQPIYRLGNGKFWNLGDAEDMPADSFEGRFAGLFHPSLPTITFVRRGRCCLMRWV